MDELNYVEYAWIKSEQSIIKSEQKFLLLKKSLNLFEDNKNLFRVSGRFGNSDMNYSESIRFYCVVIVNTVLDVMHSGLEATLSKTRRRYWIIRGRRTIKVFSRNVLLACDGKESLCYRQYHQIYQCIELSLCMGFNQPELTFPVRFS